MKFFKATIDGGHVYFKAVTWYYARDMGRMLWPMDVMEDVWLQMLECDPPTASIGLQVYERDYETKAIRQADGYEYDIVVTKKKSKKDQRKR